MHFQRTHFLGVRGYSREMTKSTSRGWPARNRNAIRLRVSDGTRADIEVRTSVPALSDEQIAAGLTRRADAKKGLEDAALRQQIRVQARLRAKKADEKHAAGAHTPSGWVPANQRNDYIDPLAKDRDPRRRNRRT